MLQKWGIYCSRPYINRQACHYQSPKKFSLDFFFLVNLIRNRNSIPLTPHPPRQVEKTTARAPRTKPRAPLNEIYITTDLVCSLNESCLRDKRILFLKQSYLIRAKRILFLGSIKRVSFINGSCFERCRASAR
jgi:hypothetical protein